MAERMTPKLRFWLEVGAAIAVVVVGLLWLHEHDQRLQEQAVAQAGQQAREEANKQSQQKIDALTVQMKQDKAENDAKVNALVQTVDSLKTPQQQVQWSQQQLVDAIKGIQITVNPKTGEATATIPAESIPQLPQVIEKCKTCELNLDTATKQLTYTQQQQQLLASQLVNVSKERDDWKVAAKGGTAFQRTIRVVKWLAIGAGAGYIAGHKF